MRFLMKYNELSFIAIMLDETSDISNKSTLYVVQVLLGER